jgi:tetratricopeptide (TPR) repeat protein
MSNSAPTEDVPDTDELVATVRPPRRKRRPVRFALLCLVALAGGAFGRQAVFPVKRAGAAEPAAPVEPPTPPPPAETDAHKVDLLLRSGRFADAAALLATAPAEDFGTTDRPRHYRVGLAREGMRQWGAAEAAYQQAAGPESDAGEWARAQLGRARVAAGRGDTAAARSIVNRVLLTSGDPSCQNVLAECLHLRGRFAVQALRPPAEPDPLDDSVPAWPLLTGGVEDLLTWLPAERTLRSPDLEERPVPVELDVRRYGWLPVPTRVTARGPAVPVAEWVGRIAAAGSWGLDVDPTAAARLADAPPVGVNVESAPVTEVLTALMEPLGLTAALEGREVRIRVTTVITRDAAQAAAQRAAALVPDHPSARPLTLAAINLDFEAGRVVAATTGYRRFADECYFAPEALHAAYNLGLIDLRAGNPAGARARFLEVIDRDPAGRWGSIGWWWVARSHLDVAETYPARAPLARARAAARTEVASAALLATALADFLDGNDAEVSPVLRATRFPNLPTHRLTAEWFQSLSRYRVAPSELRAKELHEATEAAGNGRAFGPVGVYFAGQVYRESGRTDRMAALYETGSAEGRGPVPLRMTFDVAEYMYRQGDRQGARQRYLAVAATDPSGLGSRSEVRLADLAARSGLGAECVARCRRAVGGKNVDEAELLRVMGGGYELLGQRLRAAECFAGRVPAE